MRAIDALYNKVRQIFLERDYRSCRDNFVMCPLNVAARQIQCERICCGINITKHPDSMGHYLRVNQLFNLPEEGNQPVREGLATAQEIEEKVRRRLA
jgi:hypothetical protein